MAAPAQPARRPRVGGPRGVIAVGTGSRPWLGVTGVGGADRQVCGRCCERVVGPGGRRAPPFEMAGFGGGGAPRCAGRAAGAARGSRARPDSLRAGVPRAGDAARSPCPCPCPRVWPGHRRLSKPALHAGGRRHPTFSEVH